MAVMFAPLVRNLSYIFKPMKDSVIVLQSENTNIADCYLHIVKLAVSIKRNSINTNSSFKKILR